MLVEAALEKLDGMNRPTGGSTDPDWRAHLPGRQFQRPMLNTQYGNCDQSQRIPTIRDESQLFAITLVEVCLLLQLVRRELPVGPE